MTTSTSSHDPVQSPRWYRAHPSGVETIEVTEQCRFTLGNAIKYILRAWDKHDLAQDLAKASWYLTRVLTNGEASVPPWKARVLLRRMIEADDNPIRRRLLSYIQIGALTDAVRLIHKEIGVR